jgi:hypothetical protein
MQHRLRRALMPAGAWWIKLTIAMYLVIGLSSPAHASEIMASGEPPETPAAVANQIYACSAKNSAERERCIKAIPGLSAFEYLAIGYGCIALRDQSLVQRCGTGYDKLRPMFRRDAPPEALPLSLTAAELFAMEAGCAELRDEGAKETCLTALRKLRMLPVPVK